MEFLIKRASSDHCDKPNDEAKIVNYINRFEDEDNYYTLTINTIDELMKLIDKEGRCIVSKVKKEDVYFYGFPKDMILLIYQVKQY